VSSGISGGGAPPPSNSRSNGPRHVYGRCLGLCLVLPRGDHRPADGWTDTARGGLWLERGAPFLAVGRSIQTACTYEHHPVAELDSTTPAPWSPRHGPSFPRETCLRASSWCFPPQAPWSTSILTQACQTLSSPQLDVQS